MSSGRDRPASEAIFDPPNKVRAGDLHRAELSPFKMMRAFHAMAKCGGDLDACQMPYLHSLIEDSLDMPVSVGFKASKLFSETATKEHWERPIDRAEWAPGQHANGHGAPPEGKKGEGGLPRRAD